MHANALKPMSLSCLSLILAFLLAVTPVWAAEREMDPRDPSTWPSPYEVALLQNAREVYEEIINKHGTANIYKSYLDGVRKSYEDKLTQAEKYKNIYDTGYSICEFAGSIAISIAMSGVDPVMQLDTPRQRIQSILAKEVLGQTFSDVTNLGMDTVLTAMGYDMTDLSAETFIYHEAKKALVTFDTDEIVRLLRAAEENNGAFRDAEEAALFLAEYLSNERCIATFHMGYSYYTDQLQKSGWAVLGDLVQDLIQDSFVGAVIQEQGLLIGEVTEVIAGVQSGVVFDLMDQISSHFNEPHITEWTQQMKAIDVRANDLLELSGTYETVEPPQSLSASDPAEGYEKVLDELEKANSSIGIPEYGYYALCDIQGDGISELLVWDSAPLENERGYLVYTFSEGAAVLAGKIYRDAQLRTYSGAIYALHYAPSTWQQVINCYRLDGDTLSREFFFSQEMEAEDIPESVTEWHEGTPVTFSEVLADRSLLQP